MIKGVGVDLCEVARFTAVITRRPGIVGKLFSDAEADRTPESLAARFAAKEALAKALGGPGGLGWRDAEVITASSGQPSFELRGTVAARAAELGIERVHLSLSHDAGIAIAMVICEGKPT